MVSLPAYSATSIANMALRHVPDRIIADINENTLQARECKAAYADCVAELLEDHPWEFAFERTSLAQVTNDRPGEWAFAYACPADAAYIGKIILTQAVDTDQTVYPVAAQPTNYLGLPNVPSYIGALDDVTSRAPGWRFTPFNDVLYTDCPLGAVAEYTVNQLDERRFKPLFVKALACLMAARIAPALVKDRQIGPQMMVMADGFVQRAKASDRNRQMETYGSFIPDWIAVR